MVEVCPLPVDRWALAEAKKGNKLAYAYEPVLGVLTINTAAGVKLINMPEITSYAGA